MTSFLFMLAWKSSLLLLLAACTSLALRRATAAVRHLVCCVALAAVLALPLAIAGLPHLVIPNPAASSVISATFPVAVHPALLPRGLMAHSFSTFAPTRVVLTATPRQSRSLPWATVLLGAWLVGFLILLVRAVAGILRSVGLRRRACVVADPLLADTEVALGVRRCPALLETAAISVPQAVGALRPAILLPADASEWSTDRRRIVLAHELAHVRRGDCLWLLLGQFACAAYWWNPLAWLASRELRQAGEHACDDEVLLALRGEVTAPDYAEHLTAFARSLLPAMSPLPAAAPIARTARIEKRVEAILGTHRRGRLNGAVLRLASVIATAAMLPLAAATFGPVVATAASTPILSASSTTARKPVVQVHAAPPSADQTAPALPSNPTRVLPAAEPAPPTLPQAPQAPPGARLLVIFFDLTAMAPQEVDTAASSAANYVDRNMMPDVHVGVAVLGSSLQVMQDFTADKAVLHSALARLSSLGTGGAPVTTFNLPDSTGAAPGVDRSLRAVQSVCDMLAPLPQKKSLVYFSDSISRSGVGHETPLRAAINACVKANVVIYTVDARGLTLPLPAGNPLPVPVGDQNNNTVTSDALVAQSPDAMATQSAGVTIGVSGTTCTSCPLPSYPDIARQAHLSGKVALHVQIDAGGKVLQVMPDGNLDPTLLAAAQSAVLGWQFKPATTPVTATVNVVFTLGP